jgi:hypothetical protein
VNDFVTAWTKVMNVDRFGFDPSVAHVSRRASRGAKRSELAPGRPAGPAPRSSAQLWGRIQG